jgi:RecB family exonuclease
MLVRDPLGYLWTYAFGWDVPDEAEQPLQLDALAFGTLLHSVAERAVTALEERRSGAFGAADDAALRGAVDEALAFTAREWEVDRPIPPHVLWKRTLADIRDLSHLALSFAEEPLALQRSWAEISFGGGRGEELSAQARARLPWDPALPVFIPETDIRIGGTIDRLDLSGDAAAARVTDYKTGKMPSIPPVLKAGAELQRCLYAYAVKTLIPSVRAIETRLLYPRALREEETGLLPLPEAADVLEQATAFFIEAKRLVAQGNALCGEGLDAKRAFALPGGAAEWYLPSKRADRDARLGTLPQLWEMV